MGLLEQAMAMQANGAPQAPPEMRLAQPFNDMQLVALMASQLNFGSGSNFGSPQERVSKAMDILAETIVQIGPDFKGLKELVRRHAQAKTLSE